MRKYGAARSVITGGFIRRYAAAWLFDYAADFPLPLGPLGVDAPPRLGHSVGAGFPYRAGPLSSRLPCVAGFFSTANARGPVLPVHCSQTYHNVPRAALPGSHLAGEGPLTTAKIWALFVDPAFEGRGIGRTLLALACATVRSAGYEMVRLNTAAGTRAERFYRMNGWDSVGVSYHQANRHPDCYRRFHREFLPLLSTFCCAVNRSFGANSNSFHWEELVP